MINSIMEEKGITLIALVVTIIVILILAGITISLSIGNNETIIQRAHDSGHVYANALQNEITSIDNFDREAGNIISTIKY